MALQDAVRENPISAALIGMGTIWLFMGGSNTSLFGGSGRKSIFRTAAHGAEHVGGAFRDIAQDVGSSLDHTTNTMEWSDAVRRASGRVGKAVSTTAGQAADLVASAYDATTDAASSAAETISNAASGAAQTVRDTGTKWGGTVQQNMADLFERQPRLLGAVGLAIGAGIAASIPTTKGERKVMGEASDYVRDTVTQKAAEVKEMADAALEEAKNQGLTLDVPREALRVVGEKVGVIGQGATSGQSGKERQGPLSPKPVLRGSTKT